MTSLLRTTLPVCLAALALASGAAGAAETAEPTSAISHEAENAVVKVFSTMRLPGHGAPLDASSPPSEVTG